MHAELCPICTKRESILATCPGCAGKGWVEVKNDTAIQIVPCAQPYYPWWGIYPPPTIAPWPPSYFYTTGTTTGGVHTT
jgi:hypothetical protein